MSIIDLEMMRKIAGGKPDINNMSAVQVSLNKYGAGTGLNRPHRLAHYLAQLMHESARFKYDEELWGPTAAQRRYEDRADLGHSPAIPNEAFDFRGRTGIQVTGRFNYKRYAKWCREVIGPDAPDFEQTPDLINTDPWEGLAPIWYWDAGNPDGESLNRYADDNNIEAITRKINGGMNGFLDRTSLYTRCALTLIGYPLAEGVVVRFQKDVGFSGRDLDGIAGQKTRAAMHEVLVGMAPLGSAEPVVDEEEKPVPERGDAENHPSQLRFDAVEDVREAATHLTAAQRLLARFL